ncbi:sulfur oxidation c-type cytochrome SoxX [Methylobacterium sp. WSM2598]|uniref:sulfur oxidation c-type cytochrome SoxX n=1 Tax=Methylobacterium sp. WSM2598 TaxID=398261 RepID=UPI00036D69EF|nr:sulfur oxidation c-type cytochrome SoxX [Methylobacterium sp. WSM2598]
MRRRLDPPRDPIRRPRPGHRPRRRGRCLPARCLGPRGLAAAFALALLPALAAAAVPAIEGDAIPAPLTGTAGDPARGRAIAIDPRRGLCTLCHAGLGGRPEGDVGPNLAGIGARLSPGQIRLRLVDGRVLNPDTIMPSYLRVEGLERVAPAWRGRPVLEAQEIEDVIAYLATLRGGGETR